MIKLPEKVIKDASDFLQRLLGPAVEAADLLSDKIRIIRYENAIKIIDRARNISKKEKINIKNVPLNFLVPFLEQASLQEDDEITEIWARLLTSAATDYDPILIVIKDTLTRLSSREVGFIDEVCEIDDFDYNFKDYEGDPENWLSFHNEQIANIHIEIAKRFENFPSEKNEKVIIKKYFKEIEKCMAVPLKFVVGSNKYPGVSKDITLISTELRSSVHILRNTGIFENREIKIILPKSMEMEVREEGWKSENPEIDFEERTFEAKWLQITPYGLELFLRCSKIK